MPRRSLSKIAGRFSLARLSSSHGAKKLAKVAEETAGRLKVLKGWQGELPSSFLDAKPHVVVIKGLETWRPSDVRKLVSWLHRPTYLLCCCYLIDCTAVAAAALF